MGSMVGNISGIRYFIYYRALLQHRCAASRSRRKNRSVFLSHYKYLFKFRARYGAMTVADEQEGASRAA
jgi:hypothetical protein